ncbi:MAG: type VI secretion system baseplate subunit TssG, partial [Candidatus Desantisbacteria bacterium]
MASSNRQAGNNVESRLLNEGCKFDFFQAVTLLKALVPLSAQIGASGSLLEEQIRFLPDTSLARQVSDVKKIEKIHSAISDKEIYQMTVTFMGLYGVSAPIPVYFTELITSAEADGKTLQDFLDIFNHRFISFFYQAWKKYRYYLAFQSEGSDSISNHLRALFGMDSDEVAQSAKLPITRLLRYAGILSMKTKTTAGLQTLLSDFFGGLRVRIKEFVPQWVNISEEYQNRLGAKNSQLGHDLSIGNQVLDLSGRFQVIISNISLSQYEAFLPGTEQ